MYSKCALKSDQKDKLENLLEDLEYTCGSVFADIEAEDDSVLRLVFAKANLTCNSPTEIPYYKAGKDPICYYCGTDNFLRNDGTNYPMCGACLSERKALVLKRSK